MLGIRVNNGTSVPLIQEGIVSPVRKPTQSLVKELQLKSRLEFQRTEEVRVICFLVYLGDDTRMIVRVYIFRWLSVKPNLLWGVMVHHLYQVLVKGICVEGRFAHIKYLQRLAILEKGGSIALNW